MTDISKIQVGQNSYDIKDEKAARISHTHKTSEIAGLSTVATSGNYSDLKGKPSIVTESADGFMSAADKTKLDGIEAGATASAGTITGVTAGSGLTGGGTSGNVTVAHKQYLGDKLSEQYGELSTEDYTLDWGGSFANAGFNVEKNGHITTAGEAIVTLPSAAFTRATSSAAGKAGLVPAPAAGDQGKWLRGDGT